MSLSLLRSRIETRVAGSSLTIDGKPAHIKYHGVSDKTPAPYISLIIEDAGTMPCAGNRQRRYIGNVIFTIVTPQDSGTEPQRLTADQIINKFGNVFVNGIQYGSPTFSVVSSENYRVIVPYHFDN